MADDFANLSADQKIERLRGALKAFADGQRSHDDKLVALSAKTVVLQTAFNTLVAQLARQSTDAERFVLNMEAVLARAFENLVEREDAFVVEQYRKAIAEMFSALRRAADPSGAHITKSN